VTDNDAGQATPRAELERQIMDSNVPKNEREWWAAREIERLQAIVRVNGLRWGHTHAEIDALLTSHKQGERRE